MGPQLSIVGLPHPQLVSTAQIVWRESNPSGQSERGAEGHTRTLIS